MLDYQEDIAYFLASVASELGNYYNKNVLVYIIYMDIYMNYPSGFAGNEIYDNTITYNSKFRNGEVFFPFVEVYLDYQLNEYETTWAF